MYAIDQDNSDRFEFGKNWKAFLSTLTDERIKIAENSICEMLDVVGLKDRKFLDIGSGSGLFSLAARKLGATVFSFDYDPVSVACTNRLRSTYFPDDDKWHVQQGSALDEPFLQSLGEFDVVYSWGVLHHTGRMWEAFENVVPLVSRNGILFISIYNDQGWKSKLWWKVKKLYCSGPLGKFCISSIFIPYFFIMTVVSCIIHQKNIFSEYKQNRGMSVYYDWIDWIGGFPFEVAKVEDIFGYFRRKGFALTNIKTTNSLGTNQFVFTKQ